MKKKETLLKYFLIVDDLSSQREALKAVIREVVPNSVFVEAETFVKAKKLVKSAANPIDLAVVDLKLEGSDEEGIELIKILKKSVHRKKACAILITAYPDEKNKILAKKANADAYISKLDCDVTEELQKTVLKLLGL